MPIRVAIPANMTQISNNHGNKYHIIAPYGTKENKIKNTTTKLIKIPKQIKNKTSVLFNITLIPYKNKYDIYYVNYHGRPPMISTGRYKHYNYNSLYHIYSVK